MKAVTPNPRKIFKPGLTLLELTVVIMVLLALVSVLIVGAKAWKDGSDRTGCILNIRNTQQGVRSYQNLYEKADGTSLDIPAVIIGPEGYLNEPNCPATGTYSYLSYIPFPGELALGCNLATSNNHKPDYFADW